MAACCIKAKNNEHRQLQGHVRMTTSNDALRLLGFNMGPAAVGLTSSRPKARKAERLVSLLISFGHVIGG